MKRCFDLILLFVFSPLWLPVLFVTALLVRIKLGPPVLFKQARGGLGGKVFYLWKFRSMTNQVDAHGQLLPDEQRLTSFGKFLRASSLDELPSFYNLLVGDISFVGPRPFHAEYLPLYNEFQARRHEVRPGITGWAQVNGRNSLSWEDKFKLDVWYVDNRSFVLDMKILFKTVKKVLIREGISSAGSATTEKFRGSSQN
ncbi:sugar transferase [Bdellovibrio bacteriovorus]|uniref:Sugar transferase n=1 Tax=Bdellovibrio bacteriovorus TaxID=959 RepID=A0A150WTV5_BDEBC|nr:sugar transferase [Bdellovibrio bacteriovorus]KYG69905.1 sugar transferase [Bdellovibrio bacteriovorus]